MTAVDDLMAMAARNADGTVRHVRVQGSSGQWFVMPASAGGGPVTSWAPRSPGPGDDAAFVDDHGNVLTSVVVMPRGLMTICPLDASLRPTITVSALVREDLVFSPNPGGWPLTEDELDNPRPPDDMSGLPAWQRDAMRTVARDPLGQWLTTRVRAGDGGWADVLMTEAGQPISIEIDLGVIAGGPAQGTASRIMLMPGLGGLVAVTVGVDGRPVRSGASLDRPADTGPG